MKITIEPGNLFKTFKYGLKAIIRRVFHCWFVKEEESDAILFLQFVIFSSNTVMCLIGISLWIKGIEGVRTIVDLWPYCLIVYIIGSPLLLKIIWEIFKRLAEEEEALEVNKVKISQSD